jgi:hypothetical protein
VETSCEFGIEPSGSIKYWETIEWPNNCGLSGSAELHGVNLFSFWLWRQSKALQISSTLNCPSQRCAY